MPDAFDPYLTWLGLAPGAAAHDHYTLLGLERFESDAERIRRAAEARKSQVRSSRPGSHVSQWQRLLDEVESARRCLSDAKLKADYDQQLSRQRSSDSSSSVLDDGPPLASVAESTILAQSAPDLAALAAAQNLLPPKGTPSSGTPSPDTPSSGTRPASPSPPSSPRVTAPLSPPPRPQIAMHVEQPPSIVSGTASLGEPEPPLSAPLAASVHNPMPPSWPPTPGAGAPPASVFPMPPTFSSPSANSPPSNPKLSNPIQPNPVQSNPVQSYPLPPARPVTPSGPSSTFVVPHSSVGSSAAHLMPPTAAASTTPPAAYSPPTYSPPGAVLPGALSPGAVLPGPMPPRSAGFAAAPNVPPPLSGPPVVDYGSAPPPPVVSEPSWDSGPSAIPQFAAPAARPATSAGEVVLKKTWMLLGALAFAVMLLIGALVLVLHDQSSRMVARNEEGSGTLLPHVTGSDGNATLPGSSSGSKPESPDQSKPVKKPHNGSVPKPPAGPLDKPGDGTTRPGPVKPKPAPPVDPVPQPQPQPKPAPPAPPMPKPEAPPVPELTQAQQDEVRAALRRARKALAQRDPAAAAAAVEQAKAIAGESPLGDEVHRAELLTHYVKEFWASVSTAMKGLSMTELVIGKSRAFVVSSDENQIVLHTGAGNRTYARRDLPADVAQGIAEGWLDKKAPSTKLILGAFLAVDPTLVANGGKESARKLWKQAAASGVSVQDLMPVLEDHD